MPLKKDDDISFKDVVATAGGTAAVGLGVRKWYVDTDFKSIFGELGRANLPSPFEKAYSATQNATSTLFKGIPTGRVSDFSATGLRNLIDEVERGVTTLSFKDVDSAITRALKHSDPTGKFAGLLTEKIMNGQAQTAVDLLRDLEQTAKGSSSIYMQRTVSAFLRDVDVLRGRLDQGLGLVTTELPKLPRQKLQSISLASLEGRGSLAETIQEIEKTLKGHVRLRGTARPDVPGSELRIQIFDSPYLGKQLKGKKGYKIPQATFTIPLSLRKDKKMVVKGATQQSQYIAGEFWLTEKTTEGYLLKKNARYEEWAAQVLLSQHVHEMMQEHKLTRRRIHEVERAFHQQITQPLEWVDRLPKDLHAGHDEYIGLRKHIAHLYGPAGEEIESSLYYSDLLSRGIFEGEKRLSVFPGHSPNQIANRIISLTDVRKLDPLFSSEFDWARRPGQAIRDLFTPTISSETAILEDPLTSRFGWAAKKRATPIPMVRTMYIPSSMGSEMQGLMLEGSGIISREKAAQFGQLQIERMKVASDSLLGLGEILNPREADWGLRVPSRDLNKEIEKGTVLGYDPHGEPVVARRNMKLINAIRHQDKNTGDYVQVTGISETGRMERFKVFGDAKAMLTVVETDAMREWIGKRVGGAGLGVDALISMDELRKNRQLHYKQMFTALYDYAKLNMSKSRIGRRRGSGTSWKTYGAPERGITSEFLRNPLATMNQITQVAEASGGLQREQVLSELVRIARASKLSPEQMGRVFGAVPEVFGWKNLESDWLTNLTAARLAKSQNVSFEEALVKAQEALSVPVSRGYWQKTVGLSSQEAAEISRGIPIGIAQFSFAGEYGSGSGGRGTIEPRLFEFLTAPNLGELGRDVHEEIMGRMTYRYPHKAFEASELGKSIESLIKPSGGLGLTPSQLTKDFFQKGGLVNLSGLGDFYVPAADTISQLASYVPPSGEEVIPDLAAKYRGFVDVAEQFERGEINRTAMQAEMHQFAQDITRARMLTGTGGESLMRGRLMGSRFLTAAPPNPGVFLKQNQIGITKDYAEMMLKDMEELYGGLEVGKIKEKLFAEGGSIGGMMMRHPSISPYSAVPVEFKVVEGEGPYAYFGERVTKAYLKNGDALEDLGLLRLSPMMGAMGDYDADIISAMMLSSNLSDEAIKRSRSAEADAYMIRNQLLKAKKAAVSGISIADTEAMAGAAIKLGATKEQIGLISEATQTARAAILENSKALSHQRQMNALGLLEWLEQTPISGKHIKPGEEKNILTLMGNIQQAIGNRDTESLVRNVRQVVGTGTIGARFMDEGGTVALEGLNGLIEKDIPGIGLEQAAQDISGSMTSFHKFNPAYGMSPARFRDIQRGRARNITAEEMSSLLTRSFKGASPLAGAVPPLHTPGTMSEVTQRAMAVKNRLMATGGKLIEHAKPVALGIGAAIGIAALFSSPPKTMGPGDLAPPMPRMKSGSGGQYIGTNIHDPDNYHAMKGSPTAQTPMAGMNRARISPAGTNVQVRGSSPGGINFGMLNSEISVALGGANVNSRVMDDRASLTPQRLSKIMNED